VRLRDIALAADQADRPEVRQEVAHAGDFDCLRSGRDTLLEANICKTGRLPLSNGQTTQGHLAYRVIHFGGVDAIPSWASLLVAEEKVSILFALGHGGGFPTDGVQKVKLTCALDAALLGCRACLTSKCSAYRARQTRTMVA